jgi:hypothetical protein
MLAAMVSSLVSLLIDKHSLYEHLKHQYMHSLIKEHDQKVAEEEHEQQQTIS